MSIISRVLEVMERSGKQASDVANHLDVGASTFSNWKNRMKDPPAKLIKPLSDYLNVSVYWLLTGKEDAELISAALPADEEKTLRYYRLLSEENKDLIKGEMVRLHKEQNAQAGALDKTSEVV